MRYRVGEDGLASTAAQNSLDITLGTVCFTLFVGVVFVIAGTYGRQRWLQFWGALTVLCCVLYFAAGWFGLEALL